MINFHQELWFILLSVCSINHVACEMFYIVTSPDSSCPGEFTGEPCLTLQQYVSRHSYISSNITLMMESGTHTVSELGILTANTDSSFTMTANSATIYAKPSTSYYSSISLQINDVQNVYISGITFTGVGNIII